MKIVGFHSGHDSSYAILDKGIPKAHIELERYSRRKNAIGDSISHFKKLDSDWDSVLHMTTHRGGGFKVYNFMNSYNNLESFLLERYPISIKTDGISKDFKTAKPAYLCVL